MERGYGVLLPVFSLPSVGGIGDFGPEAYHFADLLAKSGARYWQVLPLNSGNPENGESPYFSSSAYAINPLMISLELLVAAGLLSPEEARVSPGSLPDTIDYGGVRVAKLPVLERAAARFADDDAFDRFCSVNRRWLDDVVLFDTIRMHVLRPWTGWPAELRDRKPRALRAYAEERSEDIRIRKVLQYFATTQWQRLRAYCAERGLSIVGDMPIYVALDSVDVWSRPELFKLDANKEPVAVSGVPPDFFSATGQLWNNPVYSWEAHQADRFAWWVARMSHLLALYDTVRIDHFRGLVQYWEIPAGEKTAMNGAWRDVPTYQLFDTLLRELPAFPVICEDLGIITDDVRAAMRHYDFPGMKVLQFAFGDDDSNNVYLPVNYDGRCVVYTGTHDNLPTLAWLQSIAGTPDRRRVSRLLGRESGDEATVWSLVETALRSRARIAIVPLQDVLTLGAEARINDPARVQGNWQWRWDPEQHPAAAALGRLGQLASETERR